MMAASTKYGCKVRSSPKPCLHATGGVQHASTGADLGLASKVPIKAVILAIAGQDARAADRTPFGIPMML